MHELKIKCPKCESIVNTNISVEDFQSYMKNLKNYFKTNFTKCKECGKNITWTKKNVLASSFM